MEVRTEQGITARRDHPLPFTMQKSAPVQPQQPQMQGMRLGYAPDGTAVYTTPTPPQPPPSYQPVGGNGSNINTDTGATGVNDSSANTGATGGNGSNRAAHGLEINTGKPVRKKRGRPRKYGPDGSMALVLSSSPVSPAAATFSPSSTVPSSASPDGMKKRGRPKGSANKQQMSALGSAGIRFTPHVITVKAGEDVSAKIMSFSQHGPRALCILSANGAISHVTLRQAATSGGTVTYEGRFEILSLSGSFLVSESGGQRSRTGGLSISLACPDGRLLGGGVGGLLTAASPVQVVVGSFIADGSKRELKQQASTDPTSAPTKLNPIGAMGRGSSPSRGTVSESSRGPGSSLDQSTGACNNNQPGLLTMSWN